MKLSRNLNTMDPQAFLDRGYLHEVNRLLLHPLGLALAITPTTSDDGGFTAHVWDYRDEREGIYYGDDLIDPAKATAIAHEMFLRKRARREELGYVIQPVETDQPTLTTTYLNPAERQRVERKGRG